MPARALHPASAWRFDAIGTTWEITTAAPLDSRARSQVSALIAGFDAEWSRFREGSVVSRLAHAGGRVPAPADASAMLGAYRELAAATDGAINPLIGDSLAQLGYDAEYSLAAGAPAVAPPDWTSRLLWDDGILSLDGPGTIDVGALGKGRLVDRVHARVCEIVDGDGGDGGDGGDVVVDAGGDIAVRGAPQRIGLEHPFDRNRAIGVWEVTDAALCASAVNRRAWGDGLHHVLDARTGVPVRTIAATWAVAADAMRADAIATALFFDGGPRIAHEWGVDWVRMTTSGTVEWSPGCRADLFIRAASVEK